MFQDDGFPASIRRRASHFISIPDGTVGESLPAAKPKRQEDEPSSTGRNLVPLRKTDRRIQPPDARPNALVGPVRGTKRWASIA
jgi:hypothetical protein